MAWRSAMPDSVWRRVHCCALLFIRAISRFGGFPVGITCLIVESLGVLILWRAVSPWMAFGGAALAGFGFSLVFPALGVEAVKRLPERNRGTALGVYTVFADVSFFLVGPIAGAVIGTFVMRAYFCLRWCACWRPWELSLCWPPDEKAVAGIQFLAHSFNQPTASGGACRKRDRSWKRLWKNKLALAPVDSQIPFDAS